MSHSFRLLLGGLTTCVLAGSTLAIARRVPRSMARPGLGDPFATQLVDIAEVALCGVCGWLALATAASTLAATQGPVSVAARISARLTPRFWSRALGAVLGGTVCLGSVSAHAAYDESTSPGIVGLRIPDRPSGAVAPTSGDSPHARPVYVVHRGDTLWDIAADALSPGSTVAETVLECRRWYAANRSAIGSDPDLLMPGTRLHPPSDDRKGKQ